MGGIKVFLAGSTRPDAQRARDRIRIILSRLQNRLQVALYVYDFKDFASEQREYDKFIQNETDIFIALVDARFDTKEFTETEDGKGTYSEFKLACNSFLEKGKPEVILLYKTTGERRRPSRRWKTELDQIGKYALPDASYANLWRQLETELGNTVSKFTHNVQEQIPTKYRIGDIYENNGVKGIVFRVDNNGKSGKILSISQSLRCSWKEFKMKKTPFTEPWRVPDIYELEDILVNDETYRKICKTLKSMKDGVNLEHDRYRRTFLSSTPDSAFRQKAGRWSDKCQGYISGVCETSHVGLIRPVTDVDF